MRKLARIVFGIFIILHGFVHFWYVVLSQKLVKFQPDMGWTGNSWLVSGFMETGAVRMLASMLYILATLAFVASGIAIFGQWDWWRPVILGAAGLSLVTIIMFWDGNGQMLVQKGLLGFLIDASIILFLLFNKN